MTSFSMSFVRLLRILSPVWSCHGSFLSAYDLVLNTTFDLSFLRRFPVVFENSHERIAGFATLIFSREYDSFIVDSEYQDQPNDQTHISSFTVETFNGYLVIPTDFSLIRADETYLPTADIGVGPRSNLLQIVGSFIITPTSNITGQLIINPRNPSIHAFGGQIFYATTRNESTWTVPIAVRAIPADNPYRANDPVDPDQFHICTVEADRGYLWVPEEVYGVFLNAVSQLNIRSSFSQMGQRIQFMILHDLTDELIHSLPSIQYLVMDDTGLAVTIQVMSPSTYLGPYIGDDSPRTVRIRFGNMPCDLAPKVLNRVLVHVDGVNRRLGFAEPMTEL